MIVTSESHGLNLLEILVVPCHRSRVTSYLWINRLGSNILTGLSRLAN